MTNLKELKTQIEAANALGEQKLLEKGVAPLQRPAGVTGVKPPTTYDIMESIGFIQTGGDGFCRGLVSDVESNFETSVVIEKEA